MIDRAVRAAHRDFVEPRPDLDGKTILVTGGAGSFGRSFCSAVLAQFSPRKLIVFSRDEGKHLDMQMDSAFRDKPAMRWFMGDVRDLQRLLMATRDVDIIVHAAALKQVPMAEYNPFECIRTNVHGAENVVTAAIQNGVKKVVALSTDKAVNPINLYGASKLASDKIVVAANNLSGERGPALSVVRYGNVIGSRGSVVPVFRRLIAEGAEYLPITDRHMTRFWISLNQGVNFVLSCLGMMIGGEVFVPKIPSAHIVGLAQAIAPDMPLRYVGMRPGEKIHELMITQDDAANTVELEDRFVIQPFFPDHLRSVWSGRRDAKPVEKGFSYSSDANSEQLSTEDLAVLLSKLDV